MRFEDLTDYLALRRLVRNPGAAVRFRKNAAGLDALRLDCRAQPPIHLRGGREDHHIFHRIFLRDEYRLEPLLEAGFGNVIDLGGNVGLFSARIAPYAERVVVCEPVPENFACLERNLAGFDNVVPLLVAVSDARQTLQIFVPREERKSAVFSAHSGPGEGEERLADESISVEALTLAELMDEQGMEEVDLLKIDIEGAEYSTLHAAEAVLPRIRRIHGEYHDVDRADPRSRIDHFVAFLRSAGYEVDVTAHRHLDNHGMFFATRSSAG